jgi:MoaA/NifB/PqqE/SkfB family radical SAM enzyme
VARISPIAIFSITNRCNLRCKGCYAEAIRGDAPEALLAAQPRDIVAQADKAGISFFVIAGIEPLTRLRMVDIAGTTPTPVSV